MKPGGAFSPLGVPAVGQLSHAEHVQMVSQVLVGVVEFTWGWNG